MIPLFTIGFTKKSAEKFFTSLRASGVKTLVDVRLNNVSQLAGFSKRDDLRFFLKEICEIEYVHLADLAPTKEMLDAYKKSGGSWDEYAKRFLDLMAARRIEDTLSKEMLSNSCMLCSEDKPLHCHRRLVAEYLQERWNGVSIEHLK